MTTSNLISRYLDGLTTHDEECLLRQLLTAASSLTADEQAVLTLLDFSFPEEDTASLLQEVLQPQTPSASLQHRKSGKRAVALWVGGIAAALALAFILWPAPVAERTPALAKEETSRETGAMPEDDKEQMEVRLAETGISKQATPSPSKSRKCRHTGHQPLPQPPTPEPQEDLREQELRALEAEQQSRICEIEAMAIHQAEKALDEAMAIILCSTEPS